jgi:hypothetical protein
MQRQVILSMSAGFKAAAYCRDDALVSMAMENGHAYR